LYYVFLIDGSQVFGTRESPVVNAEAIQKLEPSGVVQGEETVARSIEITGRTFGLGLRRVPELGPEVLLAVLRSET
jgi:hypothetical protein